MPRVGGLAATTPTTQLTTALPRWLNSLQFRTVLERVPLAKWTPFSPRSNSRMTRQQHHWMIRKDVLCKNVSSGEQRKRKRKCWQMAAPCQCVRAGQDSRTELAEDR